MKKNQFPGGLKKKNFRGGDSTHFFDQLPPQLLVPQSVAGLPDQSHRIGWEVVVDPLDRIAWEVVVDPSDRITWEVVVDPLDHA